MYAGMTRKLNAAKRLPLGGWFGVAGAIAFSVTALGQAVPSPGKVEGPTPKAVLVEETKNVGTVAKGDQIKHSFVIRNEGKADLTISDVKPSCGCTVSEFDKVIKPGAEGKVTLTVDTKAFSGPISKTALVLTNDPIKPQFTVFLAANVKPFVEVAPWGFFRIQGLVGEELSSSLILGSDEPDFKPSKVEVPHPYLKATLAPATDKERVEGKGKTQWKITLTADKTAPPGPPLGEVKVQTGIAKQPELVLRISGNISESVGVLPTQVTFGTFDPKDVGITRDVDVINRNDKNADFKVTAAESGVPGIVAEVKPVDKTRVRVVLKVDRKTVKKGPFDGWLTIRTNDVGKPEIKVGLKGVSL